MNSTSHPSSDAIQGDQSPGILKASLSVKHVILVLSGKGGVGKTTVAVNLAYALSQKGMKTGLLDLDIHGPNVPKMLGIEDHTLGVEFQKMIPVRVTETLSVISMAFLIEHRHQPIVWRGPMKAGVIRQFLEEVSWGDLEYLVVDLPPGTGDEALSIAQIAPNIRGAVIVTTPQAVSTLDSTKAISFIEQMNLPVLGVIENMGPFTCPHCQGSIDLFGSGGGERISRDHNVPYLGSIPLEPKMREAGDQGVPFMGIKSGSPAWTAMHLVVDRLIASIDSKMHDHS